MKRYLVITQNDSSKYSDQLGVVYNYPNMYKNKVTTGARVIYYKGQLKNKSLMYQRLSDKAHYFGIATIGQIEKDTKIQGRWNAEILDYIPFERAVPVKDENDVYFEYKANLYNNCFGQGVRFIEEYEYNDIVSNAAIKNDHVILEPLTMESSYENYENEISKLNIKEVSSISIKKRKATKQGTAGFLRHNSKNSKKIGDRGELIAKKYFEDTTNNTVRHLAAENITPGYDLEYFDEENNHHCIEVKATSTTSCVDFILTVNEWRAAMEEEFYNVCLVTKCMSNNPEIYNLGNPVKLEQEGILEKEPLSYKVRLKGKNNN